LDNHSSDEVNTWETVREGKIMKCLAPRDFSFIIVMRAGKTKNFFITAYPAENPHTSARWRKEYEEYAEMHRPPS
jgi:intein/homing endonuclease